MRIATFCLALGAILGALIVSIGTSINQGDDMARLVAACGLAAVVLACVVAPDGEAHQ